MLRSLSIRDIVLIDRLDLSFRSGLCVLTGETGAGKSILLDALGLALGERADSSLVRPGAAQAVVVAEFDVDPAHAAWPVLHEQGIACEPGEPLILRRSVSGDGRSRAFINDQPVSVSLMRQIGEDLVEIHGQFENQRLMQAATHRLLLDAFGALQKELAAVRKGYAAWREAAEARQRAAADLETARREEEFLRHAVDELDKLDPAPGEEADLDARRRLMQGAERIREDIAKAFAALGPDGAEGMMGDALRWLEAVADRAEGRLEDPAAALSRALVELGEAQQGVEACLDALEFDPHELERIEERLFAIRALARKHGVPPDDLGGFAGELRARLDAIDRGAENIAALGRAEAAAQATYDAAAGALSTARKEAAARLDTAMAGELAPLKMERAVFATDLAPVDAGPEGRDAVTFTVATNPGAPAGPLDRIASGGELSRFLLALKVCLTRESRDLTMIFDEIDRGVGGATADAVGRRLARLADGAQVLVVTHSPQVAAQGAHHWRVEKHVEGEMTTSRVVPLDEPARVDEIARMLAGDRVTDEARAAARALLGA